MPRARKLAPAQVEAMRHAWATTTAPAARIAAGYGVTACTVRYYCGPRHGSGLTPAQIAHVRARVAAGASRDDAAAEVGVRGNTVAPHCHDLPKRHGPKTRLDRVTAARLKAYGVSRQDIAARFDVSPITVDTALHRHRKHVAGGRVRE